MVTTAIKPSYLAFDDDELNLLIEAAEVLRLYQQGFNDEDGRVKLRQVQRLEKRLTRIKERREQRVEQ